MANDVHIEDRTTMAKIRNPWLVLLFTLITLGIYGCFWWYFVNREMADLGRARNTDELGEEPGLSVTAFTLGSIVSVPLIWTIVTTNRRAQLAQRLTVGQSLNGWVAAALWILTFSLGGFVYLQHELNKVWRAPGMRPVDEPSDCDESADLERAEKLKQLHQAGALDDNEHAAERQRVGLEVTEVEDRDRHDSSHARPASDAGAADRRLRLGRRRAHRPPRVPRLAPRGGLRLPRR